MSSIINLNSSLLSLESGCFCSPQAAYLFIKVSFYQNSHKVSRIATIHTPVPKAFYSVILISFGSQRTGGLQQKTFDELNLLSESTDSGIVFLQTDTAEELLVKRKCSVFSRQCFTFTKPLLLNILKKQHMKDGHYGET